MVPAFANIRAGRRFAYGVQLQAFHQRFEFAVVAAGRRRRAKSIGAFWLILNLDEHFFYFRTYSNSTGFDWLTVECFSNSVRLAGKSVR